MLRALCEFGYGNQLMVRAPLIQQRCMAELSIPDSGSQVVAWAAVR